VDVYIDNNNKCITVRMNMDLNIYQVNVINKYKKIEWEVNIEIYGLALCAATNKD